MNENQESAVLRQANEGEGNKTAARDFNAAQQRFVKSGKVEEKAREAAQALEGPERAELEKAEAIGKSHAADEDPLLGEKHLRIRIRAYEIWEDEGRPDGKDRDHWWQAESELAKS